MHYNIYLEFILNKKHALPMQIKLWATALQRKNVLETLHPGGIRTRDLLLRRRRH
jgi:hypothetical protein